VHIAPEQVAACVIFRHQRIAVIQEPGDARAAAARLEQPPQRIIDEARRLHARRARQPVLAIVGERRRPVRGEIAVRVVKESMDIIKIYLKTNLFDERVFLQR
jgi:hypothetical protein